MIRRSIAQASDIKVGAILWIAGYTSSWRDRHAPMKIRVTAVNRKDWDDKIHYEILGDDRFTQYGGEYFFMGDRGVRPMNYDNRCPQVFMSEKVCARHIKLWGNRAPNFIQYPSMLSSK